MFQDNSTAKGKHSISGNHFPFVQKLMKDRHAVVYKVTLSASAFDCETLNKWVWIVYCRSSYYHNATVERPNHWKFANFYWRRKQFWQHWTAGGQLIESNDFSPAEHHINGRRYVDGIVPQFFPPFLPVPIVRCLGRGHCRSRRRSPFNRRNRISQPGGFCANFFAADGPSYSLFQFGIGHPRFDPSGTSLGSIWSSWRWTRGRRVSAIDVVWLFCRRAITRSARRSSGCRCCSPDAKPKRNN